MSLVRLSSSAGEPPSPARPALGPADPSVAASRFELDRLGQSAGSKLPCPVLTWVAAIIHTIADDRQISGGDESLTGLTNFTSGRVVLTAPKLSAPDVSLATQFH